MFERAWGCLDQEKVRLIVILLGQLRSQLEGLSCFLVTAWLFLMGWPTGAWELEIGGVPTLKQTSNSNNISNSHQGISSI